MNCECPEADIEVMGINPDDVSNSSWNTTMCDFKPTDKP